MRWLLALFLLAAPACAETLVAAGPIRAMSLIGPSDLVLVEGDTPGALADPVEAVGMEARVNLYPGRPIRAADLQPPAVIERNDIITLRFNHGGLLIVTEGRAMDRAGAGERIRVINLSSRTTVTATVVSSGLAEVGPGS
ncbi:flagella basal body P-ring formation protein FlgA [Rhodobacteraceae bacterium W635]|uniref:flagellar basal body P-ring formation chaperone FlgA n=1 Tax=Nioella halotolerans TaxID=2303578 RepID=UPI000E3E17AF|nr:flagella basal body P-ring formation protein FlgA [Rhodobacteraceae bacterium W635]